MQAALTFYTYYRAVPHYNDRFYSILICKRCFYCMLVRTAALSRIVTLPFVLITNMHVVLVFDTYYRFEPNYNDRLY